jgi:hypothetical protein
MRRTCSTEEHKLTLSDLYFCTVHVVTFTLFKPTHALLLNTLSHPHFKTPNTLRNSASQDEQRQGTQSSNANRKIQPHTGDKVKTIIIRRLVALHRNNTPEDGQ